MGTKGGDIAVETVRLLRERGYDAVLNIVGIKELPAYCSKYDFIVNHGFLNKNDKESYKKYICLFNNCHLLLLPTRAECAGVVFCEAAGFGMPAYTYATGGTENYVVNGINGYTLSLAQGALEFAERISRDIELEKMVGLHEGALRLYKEKLSWDAWSKHFQKLLNSFLYNQD